MSSGWIKLHRSLLDWEWWDDQNTTRLFIYLLISASHSRKKWKSINIEPGDIKTDQPTLSKKTGISIRGIRTSLTKLKSTGEVSVKTTNKYSVISINNWNQFQQDDSQVVTQATDKRQTNDRLTSYLKNDKNDKNDIYVDFIEYFNQCTKKRFKPNKNNVTNFVYWSKQYTQEQMKVAIKLAVLDDWWKDKLTPERLLRQRNANGACDNIGDLLNKYEGKYELHNT